MKTVAAALLLAGCAGPSLVGVERPGRDYWRGYLTDAGEVLSSHRRWERRDWLAFTGFLGATGLVYSRDGAIRDAIQTGRTPASDGLASAVEPLGGWALLPVLGAAYGLGCAFDDGRLREASLLGLESGAVAGLFCSALKGLLGRRRPFEGLGPDRFDGPTLGFAFSPSMPSGHTTGAFAVATAFAIEYRKPWVTVLAYTLAGLVGWSRMNHDAHWASDVFVGATLGIITTRGIYRARGRR